MVSYPMEIQDQMNYFALKISSQMLHCALFFEGHLDDSLLREAIRRSIEIEKILGCRLVRRDSSVFWESRDDSAHFVPFEIIETANVLEKMDSFWIQDIDLENGPLFQIRVFRNTNDCLCIKISHAISDAGGLKNYVALLARLYTDLANGAENPLKYSSSVDRSQAQILQSLEPSVSTMLSEKSGDFFRNVRPNWSFPSDGYQKAKPKYSVIRIEKELFHAIMDMAKEKKVTLNDMLLTAFCCALRKDEGYPFSQPILIQIPVDLRRYLADKNTLPICNMTGTEYLNINIDNNNFDDVLEKVHDYMQAAKTSFPGLVSAFANEFLASMGFEQAMSIAQGSMEKSIQYNVSIPIMSNMGIITDDCKSFGDLIAKDGYLVSPVMYSPGFMLGVSSFGDSLTLTVGFSEESIQIEHINKFLKRIASELEEACAYA